MTDIVERLRNDACQGDLLDEAADEIERLQHMQANLHSHIKRLEDENSGLRKENAIHASNALAAIDDYNDALAENARLKAGTTEPTNKRDRYYQRKSHRDQHEGIEALKAEAAKLREALEKIMGLETRSWQTADEIARAALQKEGGMMVDSNSTPPPWECPSIKPPKEWELGYKAGYRAALEEAAKVAERMEPDNCCGNIADAIRALKVSATS